MGPINNGEVSGTIPSSEAFAVLYPGYPSSVSRAIQTLGGYDSIASARSSESNKLELSFRPEDPYSHPLTSQLRPTNYLLLKISKKNTGKISQPLLTADIVRRITEAYDFTGMADYQHVVAVHADVTKKKKRPWSEIEQPSVEKVGLIDLDHQDLMIMLPPRFSLKDVPENLILRPHFTYRKETMEKPNESSSSQMNTESPLAIDFRVNEVPSAKNVKRLEDGSDISKWQTVVCELFEERPIWHKDSIIERLQDRGFKFNLLMIKRILLAVAYYFSGGPFQRLWIKKGYDPRNDPASRMFQITGFRVPVSLRNDCDSNSAKGLKQKFQDLCKFNGFPFKCLSSFQLYDLDDDYIQEQIRKPSTQRKCSYATGWFSKHVCDSLRVRVMVRFLSVYPDVGAKKLLKVANNEFERLKRAVLREAASSSEQDDPPIEEEGKTQSLNENEEEDRIQISNEDEEERTLLLYENEDEDDDDNNKEFDDFDEALEMAEDLPMQMASYSTNDSRVYLQQLLDHFPSKSQELVGSEEEYQIFEQFDEEESSYHDYDD